MDSIDILLSIPVVLLVVGISFYLGYWCAKYKYTHDSMVFLLERLEQEGNIRTKTGIDGEKELIPISQVVAEALEDGRAERSSK